MGHMMGFLSDSVVKNPPAMQETGVPSLGQEDALKQQMETLSSILAWEIPQTEETDYSPRHRKESDMTE